MITRLFFPIARQFYKPVKLILKARLYFIRMAPSEDQFSNLWRFCIRHQWLFALYLNPMKIPWQNLLFRWLFQIVRSRNPKYTPQITAYGSERLVDLYKSTANIIIITIHSGVTTLIVRFLEENGVKCSLIVEQKIVSQGIEADNFGFPQELDLLYRSQDVFLKARRKLTSRKVVICCIDYLACKTNQRFWKKYMSTAIFELSISTAIFDFSKKIGASVAYALPHVSDSGCIIIDFSRPRTIKNAVSSAEMAEDFIDFINSKARTKKDWVIKKWEGENY